MSKRSPGGTRVAALSRFGCSICGNERRSEPSLRGESSAAFNQQLLISIINKRKVAMIEPRKIIRA
jgi:hypothetical protein